MKTTIRIITQQEVRQAGMRRIQKANRKATDSILQLAAAARALGPVLERLGGMIRIMTDRKGG